MNATQRLQLELARAYSAILRNLQLRKPAVRERMVGLFKAVGVRACRVCGCTEETACDVAGDGTGCAWIAPDLCTNCHVIPVIPAKPLRTLKPRRHRGAR